jgi:hypothetical protein
VFSLDALHVCSDDSLMEDISSHLSSVPLLKGFQLFGTVRSTEGSHRAGLSPALRSRFTEIVVSPYSDEELEEVLRFEVQQHQSIPKETGRFVVSTLHKVDRRMCSFQPFTSASSVVVRPCAVPFLVHSHRRICSCVRRSGRCLDSVGKCVRCDTCFAALTSWRSMQDA